MVESEKDPAYGALIDLFGLVSLEGTSCATSMIEQPSTLVCVNSPMICLYPFRFLSLVACGVTPYSRLERLYLANHLILFPSLYISGTAGHSRQKEWKQRGHHARVVEERNERGTQEKQPPL